MERRTLYTLGGLLGAVALSAIVFGRSPKSAASSRLPTDPAEVLETLPSGAGDARRVEIGRLRAALAQNPNHLTLALRLAKIDVQLARERRARRSS